eukprot:11988474-Ditylum_brightwellii.AAC.2
MELRAIPTLLWYYHALRGCSLTLSAAASLILYRCSNYDAEIHFRTGIIMRSVASPAASTPGCTHCNPLCNIFASLDTYIALDSYNPTGLVSTLPQETDWWRMQPLIQDIMRDD